MNLVIDLGNTSSHLYLYEGRMLVERRHIPHAIDSNVLLEFLGDRQIEVVASIISNVVDIPLYIEDVMHGFKNEFDEEGLFIHLNHKTALPIKNLYQTPETLGTDRLAAAVGASALFPDMNVLIIDAGTCIKYDFVNSKAQYLGGSITPGFKMRFQALNHFTGKLPLLKPGHYTGTGNTTETSMKSGVFMGIIMEMNGFINYYKENKGLEKVILTGGDAHHFEKELNFSIFAEPDLTGIGLNEILLHNQNLP
jgi:type III pantothenate kinase